MRMVKTFDHYVKDGETYSIYTHVPAVMVPENTAHEFCNMSKRAFTAAKKKQPLPASFENTEDNAYMDYDLQTWMNVIETAKSLKPTWKRGLEKLKNLNLIDRPQIIHKLTSLYNKEWTPGERDKYWFNDQLIRAYRKGVEEALDIVYSHQVETWDYTPSVNDVVLIDSTLGMVIKIIGDRVLVGGVTRRPMKEPDNWVLEYSMAAIMDTGISLVWNSKETPNQNKHPFVWDYRDIHHIRIL